MNLIVIGDVVVNPRHLTHIEEHDAGHSVLYFSTGFSTVVEVPMNVIIPRIEKLEN